MTTLKAISMNFNELTELPDSIGQLTKLYSISFSDNRITQLPDN